jgi:hypothetical protein
LQNIPHTTHWTLSGLWELLLEAFNDSGGGSPSLQLIDSTIIRAHYYSVGAKGEPHQGLGRSKCGFTAKRNRLIPLTVDPAISALRNMVERYFFKLKTALSVATRYDKTADSSLGFFHRLNPPATA